MADNNQPANLQQLFSGVRWVPGLGYVGGASGNQLGDDASVMMISGLGSDARQVSVDAATGAVVGAQGGAFNLMAALRQPVKIGAIELPLWAWLLIGAGALGVAGYFLLFKKK